MPFVARLLAERVQIADPLCDPLDGQQIRARRDQFDRERKPIELANDRRDVDSVVV